MTVQVMTVTEALSKINLTQKKIADKRTAMQSYIVRPEMMRDPLEGDGGSEKFVTETRQAIRDLEQYLVNLRLAVAKANTSTQLTVCGETKIIAEWLVWRRDIAPNYKTELRQIVSAIQNDRSRYGQATRQSTEAPPQVVVNLSEVELHKEVEQYTTIMEELDGQLSLKNATTFVEI